MPAKTTTDVIPETTTTAPVGVTKEKATRKKAASEKKPAEKKVATKRAPRTKKTTTPASNMVDTPADTPAGNVVSTPADTPVDTPVGDVVSTPADSLTASVKVTTYCGNEFYFRSSDQLVVEAYDPVSGMDASRKVYADELQVNWRIPCEWREEIHLGDSSDTQAGVDVDDLIQKTIEIMTHPKAGAQLIKSGDACWVKCRLPCLDNNAAECDEHSEGNVKLFDENHLREIVWRWRAIGGNVCIAKNKLVRRVFVRCNVRGPHMSEAVSDVLDIIFKANVMNFITSHHSGEHKKALPAKWLSSLETNIDEWKEHYAVKSIEEYHLATEGGGMGEGVYCDVGSIVEQQRANGWYYNIKLVM